MPRKRSKVVSFKTEEDSFDCEMMSSSATDLSEASLKTSSQSHSRSGLLEDMNSSERSLESNDRDFETPDNAKTLSDYLLRKDEIKGCFEEEDDDNGSDDDDEPFDDDSCGKYKITKSDIITFLCLVVSTFIRLAGFFDNGTLLPKRSE